MNRKEKFFLSIISIIITLIVIGTATFAWFYFPSSNNLIIETAPGLPVEMKLYELVLNEEAEKYEFVLIEDDITDNVFEVTTDIIFFQWGDEYICESTKDYYYALDITYDSNAYSDGYLKSMVNASLECASDVTYKLNEEDSDEDAIKLRFGMVNVSYAFASECTMDILSIDASLECRSSDFTTLTFSGYEDDDQTQDSLMLNGVSETILYDLQPEQYNHYFMNPDTNLQDSYIHLIMYVKVSADEANVNAKMPDSTLFSGTTYIHLTNKLTFEAIFRSVPTKSREESNGD